MTSVAIRPLSVYPKIVFVFLMVAMPLYILGLAMNQSGSNRVKAEIQQSLELRAHFYLTSFETEFQRIVKLRNEYVYDGDLQEISVTAIQQSGDTSGPWERKLLFLAGALEKVQSIVRQLLKLAVSFLSSDDPSSGTHVQRNFSS